jgi:rhamnosyltransferase
VFDAKPSLLYRQHAGNDTGARTGVAGGRKRLGLIKSGWYSGQQRALAELLGAARPDDDVITRWRQLLEQRRGPVRTLRVAGFCLRGGRRRPFDQIVLVGAALIGWI